MTLAHLSLPPIPLRSLSAGPGRQWAFSKCTRELVAMLPGWPHNTQSAKSRLLSLPPPGNFINKSLALFQEEFQGFSACVCVCVCFQKHNHFTCCLVCKLLSSSQGGMRVGRAREHRAWVRLGQRGGQDTSSERVGWSGVSAPGSANLVRRHPGGPQAQVAQPPPPLPGFGSILHQVFAKCWGLKIA